METKKKKNPTVDAWKKKRRESKPIIIENHQVTKEDKKRGKDKILYNKVLYNDYKTFGKAKNKMTLLSPYLLIITLNLNRLNSPNKRYRKAEWIKNKPHIYSIYNRLTD